MGSEAPCCGVGLSGIGLLIIHFIFFKTPKYTFLNFPKFLTIRPAPPPPHHFHLLKTFERSSKYSQNITELKTPTYRVFFDERNPW